MSDPRDKLPAIAGVAEEFRRLCGDAVEYHASVWSDELVGGLLWKVFIPKTSLGNSIPYRAPSWSQASSDGEVIYTLSKAKPVIHRFDILSCNTVPRNPSLTISEVQAGMLQSRALSNNLVGTYGKHV